MKDVVDQRSHRRAADGALAHRNPSVPGHYVTRHGHHRHRGARVRHRALAARRGLRQRHRCSRRGAAGTARRSAGPAAHLLRDGSGVLVDVEIVGQHAGTATTSAARSSGGTAPSPWPTPTRWSSAARAGSRRGARRTGASGSCAPTTSSCRPGWTRWPPGSVRPGRAPGTATPPPSSPTPPWRPCAPATRWSSGSARHRRSTPTGRAGPMTAAGDLEVLTVGRVGVDLYPEQPGAAGRRPTFAQSLGGTATNVAVGAARLGRRTAVLTKVGDDGFGDVRPAGAGRLRRRPDVRRHRRRPAHAGRVLRAEPARGPAAARSTAARSRPTSPSPRPTCPGTSWSTSPCCG